MGQPLAKDNFEIIYQDDSADGIGVTRDSCGESGYVCGRGYSRDDVPDSVDKRRTTFARVRWTGDETQGGLFRQDVNNGDHCFACKASHPLVTRDFDLGCVRGKGTILCGTLIMSTTYSSCLKTRKIYLVTASSHGHILIHQMLMDILLLLDYKVVYEQRTPVIPLN